MREWITCPRVCDLPVHSSATHTAGVGVYDRYCCRGNPEGTADHIISPSLRPSDVRIMSFCHHCNCHTRATRITDPPVVSPSVCMFNSTLLYLCFRLKRQRHTSIRMCFEYSYVVCFFKFSDTARTCLSLTFSCYLQSKARAHRHRAASETELFSSLPVLLSRVMPKNVSMATFLSLGVARLDL